MKRKVGHAPNGRPISRHWFFWFTLIIAILVLGFYITAGHILLRYGALMRESGWGFSANGDGWYVSTVDPQGEAAGKLQRGDHLLAINDDAQLRGVSPVIDKIPPQSLYKIEVQRGSTRQKYELKIHEKRQGVSRRNLSFAFLSIPFLALGRVQNQLPDLMTLVRERESI